MTPKFLNLVGMSNAFRRDKLDAALCPFSHTQAALMKEGNEVRVFDRVEKLGWAKITATPRLVWTSDLPLEMFKRFGWEFLDRFCAFYTIKAFDVKHKGPLSYEDEIEFQKRFPTWISYFNHLREHNERIYLVEFKPTRWLSKGAKTF